MINKNLRTIFAFTSVFAAIGAAQAGVPTGAKFSFGGHGGYQHFIYKSIKGWEGGLNASAAYHFDNHFFLDTGIKLSGGKTKAKTTISDNDLIKMLPANQAAQLLAAHIQSNINSVTFKARPKTFYLDARAAAGYHIAVNNTTTFSPYFGGGCEFHKTKSGPISLRVTTPYVAVGAKTIFNINKDFEMSLNAEYNYYLPAKFKATFKSPGYEASGSEKIHAGKLHGVKASLKFSNMFGNNTSVSYGPYVQYISGKKKHIGKASNLKTGLEVTYNF